MSGAKVFLAALTSTSMLIGAAAFAAGSGKSVSEAERHAQTGLAAATDFPGYASLCDLDSRMRNVNVPRRQKPAAKRGANGGSAKKRSGNRPEQGLERVLSPLPPMQVFDNLYFLGTSSVSAWLYGNGEGYVLLDGLNTDEEAETYIFGGMKQLGLDPQKIRHVLVTHGHGDHYGGADYVAEKLGIDVLMSKADWDLVATLGDHPRFGPPPAKGGTVKDGDILEFGSSKMQIVVTPGHTPGTISPIFEVYDNGEAHHAVLWGGTGFNFGPNVEIFEDYAQSANRLEALSEEAGVDVFLSNHPRRDGSNALMAALAERQSGEPHPFVKGEGGMALFTVLSECALAQAARFASQQK
ncbi:MBL fold metallo-hydrolase [Nitratireductor basaltis]|uniref:Beta-lactamase-like protein n=1 Tax=Nitratireductor basaltis TaxID=472175 RepID=A0A084U9F2_9HYPH|nr:MBL fold metallo-hydrolase [Nitratireductor basaltis]KFB09588.1 Beta-lactamase-like protein [Nitratireductor basaltis]